MSLVLLFNNSSTAKSGYFIIKTSLSFEKEVFLKNSFELEKSSSFLVSNLGTNIFILLLIPSFDDNLFLNLMAIPDSFSFYNLFSIKDSQIFKLLNQYGTWLESFQVLINEIKGIYEDKTSPYVQANKTSLLLKDFFISNTKIINSFTLEKDILTSLNTISEGFQSVQSIINKINLNELLQSIQLVLGSSQLDSNVLTSLNTISEGFQSVQSIINKIDLNKLFQSIQLVLGSSQFDSNVSASLNTISEGFQSVQSIINKIDLNELFQSIQLVLSSSQFDSNVSASLNTISEGFQSVQSIINKIDLNELLQSIQLVLSSSQLDSNVSASLNTISEGFQSVQSVINKLFNADSLISSEVLLNSIELNQAISSLQGIVSEGKYKTEPLKLVLSDAEQSVQSFINDISNLSNMFGFQKVLNFLGDTSTFFSSIDYKIYLDGTDVSRLIKSEVSIDKNQSNIHNSISFSSISQDLFNKADPSLLEGEARIEVHLGSAVMFFLLEERSFSSDGSVSYWGRDITAKDNSPWASSASVSLSEWISAKELCESLVVYSVIEWNILDWILPNTYESTGTPIEIISGIVSEIGAIVRAQDDGSLNVRYPFPVRPVDVKTSPSAFSYLSDMVYNISYSEERKEGYNIVTVTADTDNKTAPTLEIEDVADNGDRIIGLDSYIRVFYHEDPSFSPSVLSQDQTDGSLTFLTKDNQEITEIIHLIDGHGSSSYPLKTLKEVSWLGRTNNILTWNEYSTDIVLETGSTCLAEITYDSEYHRYKASGHNVKELLTIFDIQSTFLMSVKVKTAPIIFDKEGNEITTSLLTSQAALIKRGEIWIDSNKYDEEIVSFETPFLPDVKDGDIIWLEADRIVSGNYQVFDASVSISGPKVVNTMQVKKWQI